MRSCLDALDVSPHLLLRDDVAESGNSQCRTYRECSASFPVNSPVQHISTPNAGILQGGNTFCSDYVASRLAGLGWAKRISALV